MPVPLRRVAKFAPNRRARLGGPAIAAQLAADPLFRQRVSTPGARRRRRAGRRRDRRASRPAAADPVEVAALAYLARPDGLARPGRRGRRGGARRGGQRRRRRAGPRRRAAGRPGRARPRRGPGRGRQAARRAGPGPRGAGPAARGGAGRWPGRCARRRPRERKADRAAGHREGPGRPGHRRPRGRAAPAAGQAGRRGGGRPAAPGRRAKDARAVDDARLWLLLETIGQAAVGLRRELALDPADRLPADFVADAHADRPGRHARPRPGPRTPTTRPGSTSCSRCPGRT